MRGLIGGSGLSADKIVVDALRCPFCGYGMYPVNPDWIESWGLGECKNCGKRFLVERKVHVTFVTSKIMEEDSD